MPDESSTSPAGTQAPPSEPTPAPESAPAEIAPPPEQSAEDELTGKQAEISEAVPEPERPIQSEARTNEPVPELQSEPVQTNPPAPKTEPPPFTKEEFKSTGTISELLTRARAKIQEMKRKKLDKIMVKLAEKGPASLKLRRVNAITNDEVEKLLHVSDATATRYLQMLEKENRIKQTGRTGKAVFYEPR